MSDASLTGERARPVGRAFSLLPPHSRECRIIGLQSPRCLMHSSEPLHQLSDPANIHDIEISCPLPSSAGSRRGRPAASVATGDHAGIKLLEDVLERHYSRARWNNLTEVGRTFLPYAESRS